MTVMVALLRGVNVGGRAKLAMADLRRVVESCGYEDARTYIQSGNVVFTTSARSADSVASTLRAALAKQTSVRPEVMARTRAELTRIVGKNPFLARGEDPAHLHVTFTADPAKTVLSRLDLDRYAPEEAIAEGRHVYLLLPGGVGRSRLAGDVARLQKTGATMRNWRTVTTLLAMADELASSD